MDVVPLIPRLRRWTLVVLVIGLNDIQGLRGGDMFSLSKREQIIITVSIILLLTCIGIIAISYNRLRPIELYSADMGQASNTQMIQGDIDEKEEGRGSKEQEEEELVVEVGEPQKIVVHVKGSVNNPGVVILEEGQRVFDAIESSGGALEGVADLNRVNLAQRLQDEQEVYVPAKGEEIEENKTDKFVNNMQQEQKSGSGININTASLEELQQLPGIGPVTAQSIIKYRTQNKKFTSINDIMNVSGIGDKKFEQIRDLIRVD